MRDLIAISGKQYAGKDLLADYLLALLPEFHKVPLARAIKTEFANMYHLSPHEVEAEKAKYRPSLIALGQRRRQQDPDYWIRQVLAIPGPKIIPDLRMKREYEFFRLHKAFCIRVEADRVLRAERGTLAAENDVTECELDDVKDWDYVVTNNGSPEDLKRQAEAIVQMLQASPTV